ncbi:MAG TPA: heavy metal translocating P-type ATPase [Vicinamibacterales bacterium]|jgi:Cd2+/Zn2+-exporting ATPase|nr:heavy metal translocating P-type ATPase [Vicinamibacterales bacterium]
MARTVCAVCEIHAESIFKVEGMDCHEEVAILERRLKRLPGLEDLAADVISQRLRVKYDAAKLTAAAIAEAVAQTGMRAWLEHEEPVRAAGSVRARRILVVVSGVALAAGLLTRLFDAPRALEVALLALSVVTGGLYTVRRALSAARTFSLDINVLMLVAVAGAVLIGEWFEAATVVFLFALAQFLEARSMDRARGAIRALMDVTPVEALVRRDGAERRVSVDEVAVGDTIIVKPGEKIPLDGRVAAGESHVNQAPVTGESLPIDKCPGDDVFAGTINGRGALEVIVTRPRRDTTLARIIHLVERAQAQRAPSQAFVDRFARWYTPAVLVLALAIASIPPLAGAPAGPWLYRALVLLVISCPCALVISTPVSIVSALAAAARKGVLIKGGVHLERTGAVRCVAFDKTGTLTKGRLHVTDVEPLDGASAETVLGLAAALEIRSEHPIGRAIVRRAAAAGIAVAAGDSFQALPGRGAEARIAGSPAVVGSHRLFEERGLCSPKIHDRLDALAARGRTAILVARGGEAIGVIGVADELREASRDAVDLLRQQGVRRVALLTGDNTETANAIAREIGVDEVRAELLPEDKVAAIEDLRRRYGTVVMVGDGVNDAPALATADVGIAMGAAGSDAALETADVALMADELLKIPYAVRLSRATVRNIRANIAFSLALKAAFLGLAVAGIATLWMAVVADMGASLIVIANGLRLLRTD